MQWTEKYRPTDLDDVVGNPKAVETLRAFADGWASGDPDPRALVLSGDPGVGKSSAAHALAKERGWGVVELNTSDQRNRDAIERVALAGAVHETFGEDGSFQRSRDGQLKLVVLDEADNLFGRKDLGGAGAMVETLRQARQPVVLIVNDYYELTRKNQAFRGLAEEVKFYGIRTGTVKKVLRRILSEEGIQADDEVIDAIADTSGGDLRGAINDLEMLCRGRSRVSKEDLDALGYRNRTPSIFDALDKVFHGRDAGKARKATWDLDESPEDLILWIDENLPDAYEDPATRDDAFATLARADRFLGRVHRRQEYGFWSYARDLMTAGVCAAKGDRPTSRSRYGFPDWLKQMSRSRSTRNTRDRLAESVGENLHTGPKEVLSAHLPFLRHMFVSDPQFAAWATFRLGLTRDQVAFLLETKKSAKKVGDVLDAAAEVERQVLGRSRDIDRYAEDDAPEPEAPPEPDEPEADDEDGDEGDQASLLDY